MNIEKELNCKRKRIGDDKNLSRTLHSLRFVAYPVTVKNVCSEMLCVGDFLRFQLILHLTNSEMIEISIIDFRFKSLWI